MELDAAQPVVPIAARSKSRGDQEKRKSEQPSGNASSESRVAFESPSSDNRREAVSRTDLHDDQARPVGLTARDEAALAFWSQQYGRQVTAQELYEIRHNLGGFFKLLLKLENRNRYSRKSNVEEQHEQ